MIAIVIEISCPYLCLRDTFLGVWILLVSSHIEDNTKQDGHNKINTSDKGWFEWLWRLSVLPIMNQTLLSLSSYWIVLICKCLVRDLLRKWLLFQSIILFIEASFQFWLFFSEGFWIFCILYTISIDIINKEISLLLIGVQVALYIVENWNSLVEVWKISRWFLFNNSFCKPNQWVSYDQMAH